MIKVYKNEWTIIEKVGEGTTGEVYKAVNKKGEYSAIKHISLPKNDKEIDELIKNRVIKSYAEVNNYYEKIVSNIEQEIDIMKKLNDSNLTIKYYDSYFLKKEDTSGIDIYIRYEYAKDILKEFSNKTVDVNEVINLAKEVCSILDKCLSLNIAHNDIKPANIFITNDGKYKLGDFGVATSFDNNKLESIGTLSYMAPEVYNNKKVNKTSDCYSLGIVMYQLITGKLPFPDMETKLSGVEVPIIEKLDKRLMTIIRKATAFKEEERYKAPLEMLNDLSSLPRLTYSNTKKYNPSNAKEKTLGIYEALEEQKGLKGAIRNNKSLEKFKNSALFYNVKEFFSKHTVIKLGIVILILILVLFLSIRAFMLNRKCKTGYVNDRGMCVKGYYYCKEGFSLNSNNKCQKTVKSTDAKVSYNCKKGYTLNDGICVSDDVRDPKYVYKCADGFTLNGTKCSREESADAALIYTCPSQYVLVDDQCLTVANVTPSVSYTCPNNSYTLTGTTCTSQSSNKIAASVRYSCDANGTLSGTSCIYKTSPSYSFGYYPRCYTGTYNYMDRMCHYTKQANISYYCPNGTLDGNSCVIGSNNVIQATKKYTCPSGYTLAGTQCAKTSGVKATPKYMCTDDTELRGSKCYATITTDAVGMYSCDDGFVISGTKCLKNDFPRASKKYTCSKAYTLNGGKCEKYEIINAKVHYADKK